VNTIFGNPLGLNCPAVRLIQDLGGIPKLGLGGLKSIGQYDPLDTAQLVFMVWF
jgi:hypothetical protein